MQQTFTVEEAAKLISAASERTGTEQLTLDEVLKIADELGVEPQAVKAVALSPEAKTKPVELKLNFPVIILWIGWMIWTATTHLLSSSGNPAEAPGWIINYVGSLLAVPFFVGLLCGRKLSTLVISALTAVCPVTLMYLNNRAPRASLSEFLLVGLLAICLTMVGSLLTEYFLRFRSHQR
jgi:hypothetical protein